MSASPAAKGILGRTERRSAHYRRHKIIDGRRPRPDSDRTDQTNRRRTSERGRGNEGLERAAEIKAATLPRSPARHVLINNVR